MSNASNGIMCSSSDGFVGVCVCLCERILSTQQPDVCRAIPLRNYLRTSGTYKHSKQLQLCLFFFVPYCLFIIVLFRKSFPSWCFFLTQACFCFVLRHKFPARKQSYPFLAWTHSLSIDLFCHPYCICTYPLYFPLPPGLHTAFSPSWSPHGFLSRWLVFSFSYLSLLLTLVKTSSPPWAPTAAGPIWYSNVFSTKSSPGVSMCCVSWIYHHANDWWTVPGSFLEIALVTYFLLNVL